MGRSSSPDCRRARAVIWEQFRAANPNFPLENLLFPNFSLQKYIQNRCYQNATIILSLPHLRKTSKCVHQIPGPMFFFPCWVMHFTQHLDDVNECRTVWLAPHSDTPADTFLKFLTPMSQCARGTIQRTQDNGLRRPCSSQGHYMFGAIFFSTLCLGMLQLRIKTLTKFSSVEGTLFRKL